jgi:hypothetical protein
MRVTMRFNYDLDGIGEVEVTASWFLGRIRIERVRRNDGHIIQPDKRDLRDMRNCAKWYFEDQSVLN